MSKLPKVIDLFAGAGGLSLGAARAGFSVAASVEIDPQAIETHKKNFTTTKHLSNNVALLSGEELLYASGLKHRELQGLIGGPPCQGFSTMGKRDLNDERNSLFFHFFRLVKETNPEFFLAENVPGILDSKYDGLRNEAIGQVSKEYFILDPLPIRASEYGAPTTRTRVFYIGIKKKNAHLLQQKSFEPTKTIRSVTVRDALIGLPIKINPLWQLEEDGWQQLEIMPNNSFVQKLVGEIPNNVGDKLAIERLVKKKEVSGCLGTIHRADVEARYANLSPGQQDKVSKAVKLDLNGYCPTLRAGTAKEKGSYQAVRPIHPTESRVITPREAARLQGFPDWFIFHRTKWHSFRQIGNSVSPIVAEYLLRQLQHF